MKDIQKILKITEFSVIFIFYKKINKTLSVFDSKIPGIFKSSKKYIKLYIIKYKVNKNEEKQIDFSFHMLHEITLNFVFRGNMQENRKNNRKTNTRIYNENGCIFRITREFEEGGISILEQIISYLFDLMQNENKKEDL